MQIETRKMSELKLWDKNPRAIDEVDFNRLKNLIKELGLFKPFLVNKDGVILGGNMRFRVCQSMNFEDVQVSVVDADSEEKMLAYAMADNDRAGYYEDDKLAELVLNNPTLNLENYKVDLGKQTPLKDVLLRYSPDEFGTDFDLPSGEKAPFEQMTFTLSNEQAEFIKDCLVQVDVTDETFGNENSNGNALYSLCKQWNSTK